MIAFRTHWFGRVTRTSLVVAVALAAWRGSSAVEKLPADSYAALPEKVSSFGAVESNGYLYVYGGHTAPVHTYSTEGVSGRFHRLALTPGAAWETLEGGTPLQGMNLAAHDGKVYRIGGMAPRNKPGDPTENYSVADCARFDPGTGKWETLPALPEPRSSHDVAVIDDKLYVVGGWSMFGKDGEDWLDSMLVLDLKDPQAGWKAAPQPFVRRALIAAVNDGKLYVIGGFSEESQPSKNVEILDAKTGEWTSGPELPGRGYSGFAPAACACEGHVYASVADGTLYRLNLAANKWDEVAKLSPRIVHRLAPSGSRILVVGGAAKRNNLDLIEAVDVANP